MGPATAATRQGVFPEHLGSFDLGLFPESSAEFYAPFPARSRTRFQMWPRCRCHESPLYFLRSLFG